MYCRHLCRLTELQVALRLAQIVDKLLDLDLGLVQAGNVLEGDLGHARLEVRIDHRVVGLGHLREHVHRYALHLGQEHAAAVHQAGHSNERHKQLQEWRHLHDRHGHAVLGAYVELVLDAVELGLDLIGRHVQNHKIGLVAVDEHGCLEFDVHLRARAQTFNLLDEALGQEERDELVPCDVKAFLIP